MVVTTHAEEHWFEVIMNGVFHWGGALLNEGPIHVESATSHTQSELPELPLTDDAATAPQPTLCEGLIH